MLIRYDNEQQLSETTLLCNTEEGGLFANIAANNAEDVPRIGLHRTAILVGGGPSLAGTLGELKALKDAGGCIFAMNNSARFLAERGIKPDYQVVIDPREQNVEFIEKAWAGELLLASHAHPLVLQKAREIGYPVRLWHPSIDGIAKVIGEVQVVTASITAGLSAISLAHTFGHREFHFFGYDSSHEDGKSHAYRQDMNAQDEIVRCAADNRVFYASMAMAGQANQFREFRDMMTKHLDCVFHVHGDGLLPHLWRSWEREEKERTLTAVYDLGVSPPTYDFLSFLIEAERHRKANGYDWIDLMFMPGPIHGFRDDDLPPNLEARKEMLWGVCVAMARLLPSVRNVNVQKRRWNVPDTDIFPVGYKQEWPIAHYGTKYLKGGEPLLQASESARYHVAMRFTKPYATITLREASYWPDRNSNKPEWTKVAGWLKAQGIMPVVIPDTNGTGLEGFQEFAPAAFDMDLRAALYEGAVVNLGVLNGPMSIIAYLKARYLIVKVNVETAVASTTEFLKAHGFENGDDFGGEGKMIWKPDTFENIVEHLKEFEVKQPEKTS